MFMLEKFLFVKREIWIINNSLAWFRGSLKKGNFYAGNKGI